MKKFFNGVGNLIKRHKILFTICLFAIIITFIMIYIFFNLFIGGTNKYGDRLKDLEQHEISSSVKEEVVSFLEEKEEVTDASMRTQGKIIYIHIEYKKEVTLDKAKEIANESLTKIQEEEKEYYDIGFFLTQEQTEENTESGFNVTGTKSSQLEKISWIRS